MLGLEKNREKTSEKYKRMTGKMQLVFDVCPLLDHAYAPTLPGSDDVATALSLPHWSTRRKSHLPPYCGSEKSGKAICLQAHIWLEIGVPSAALLPGASFCFDSNQPTVDRVPKTTAPHRFLYRTWVIYLHVNAFMYVVYLFARKTVAPKLDMLNFCWSIAKQPQNVRQKRKDNIRQMCI